MPSLTGGPVLAITQGAGATLLGYALAGSLSFGLVEVALRP